ncbi:MAG: mechanosensitive ion channel [Lachnospiraceae bacterium]|nr:mechanosensitive ion channel [Lachnospiraceae bacterium]
MTDMEAVLQKTVDYFGGHIPGVAAFLVKIIVCIVIYIIGKNVIGWVVKMVRSMLLRTKMQTGAATFIVSMLKIFLYLILIFGIAMQFGVKESSVAALVASGGVAIGLALQGGLSNLAGGFLILLFQPFEVGDYILAQGEEGTVQKIEILYTTLHTIDNRKVIIPNGNLANNVIVNATGADRRKLDITVGISYEDDISKAKQVLLQIIERSEYVIREQEAQVFVSELGDSSVVMGLRCWVRTEQYLPALWQMNEQIKNEFDRAGLHIPFPQMDVHVRAEK